MRLLSSIALLGLLADTAAAQDVRRMGAAEAPISASVEVAAGSRLIYVSGNVPDPVDANAPAGSVARYGDTAAQTRSVLRKLQTALAAHGLGFSDVVMMRVFLVAPPGQARMDFAGMMTAYREYFGTAAQPNRPARSTMQVAGLVDPGFLVEIEVTAAARPGTAAAAAHMRSGATEERAAESDAALLARADAISAEVGAAAPDYAIGLESGQAWVWAAAGGYLMVSDASGGRRNGSRFYYFAPGSTTPFLIRTAQRNIIVRRGEMTAAYEMDGDPVAMAAMTALGSTAVTRGEALGAALAGGDRQAVNAQAFQEARAQERQAEQRAESRQRDQAEGAARRQAEAQAERQREQAAPPPPPPR